MKNQAKLLDQIFDKIKLTPFIGIEERQIINKNYYSLTSDSEKLKVIQGIRFNYCNHKFLSENIYSDLIKIENI